MQGRSENPAVVVIDLEDARKRLRPKPARVIALLELAQSMAARLADGSTTRAELAREEGLSRARVTQLLQLMALRPEIRAFVRSLPAGTGAHAVSVRKLCEIAKLPKTQQLAAARSTLVGFELPSAKAGGSA